MNEALNRRVANYLRRLGGYFARPQIFNEDALRDEADKLANELDADRQGTTTDPSGKFFGVTLP